MNKFSNSLSKFFPVNFNNKLLSTRLNQLTQKYIHTSTSMEDSDIEEQVNNQEYVQEQPQRSNSITDKKFMLVAKIKALEEYVEHLEHTVAEQTSYIESFESTKETALMRSNSI